MYAASLASLGLMPGIGKLPGMNLNDESLRGDDAKDISKSDDALSSKDKASKKDESDFSLSGMPSLHPSFPLMFNPLLLNQFYAQSLAAAGFSLPSGLPTAPFTGLTHSQPDDDEVPQKDEHVKLSSSKNKSSSSSKPATSTSASQNEPEDLSMPNTKSSSFTSAEIQKSPLGDTDVRASTRSRRKPVSTSRKRSPSPRSPMNKHSERRQMDWPQDLSVVESSTDKTSRDAPPRSVSVDNKHSQDESSHHKTVVIGAVHDEENSISQSDSTQANNLSAIQLKADASHTKSETVAPSVVMLNKSPAAASKSRGRSSLIDMIGTKLLAKKQQVESEKQDGSGKTETVATVESESPPRVAVEESSYQPVEVQGVDKDNETEENAENNA